MVNPSSARRHHTALYTQTGGQSNRVEYLAACGEVRRLSEGARRTKWEEFLADLEDTPYPAGAWDLIKSLSGSSHTQLRSAKPYSTTAAR